MIEKLKEQKERIKEYYQAKRQLKQAKESEAREKRREIKAIEREAYTKAREKYMEEQRAKAIKTAEERGEYKAKHEQKGMLGKLEDYKEKAGEYISRGKKLIPVSKKPIVKSKAKPSPAPSYDFADSLGFGSAPKSKGSSFDDVLGFGSAPKQKGGFDSGFSESIGFFGSSAPAPVKYHYRKVMPKRKHKVYRTRVYHRQPQNKAGGFSIW